MSSSVFVYLAALLGLVIILLAAIPLGRCPFCGARLRLYGQRWVDHLNTCTERTHQQ